MGAGAALNACQVMMTHLMVLRECVSSRHCTHEYRTNAVNDAEPCPGGEFSLGG